MHQINTTEFPFIHNVPLLTNNFIVILAMTLFTKEDHQRILEFVNNSENNILITFRMNVGPSKLEREWNELIADEKDLAKCIHWWSSSGTIGLIECEFTDGRIVLGQWALGDEMQLLGLFEVDDGDIVNIKDGFDSGNVWAPEMRAIRIGETGDQD
jgi:hypothetical protein